MLMEGNGCVQRVFLKRVKFEKYLNVTGTAQNCQIGDLCPHTALSSSYTVGRVLNTSM